MWLKPICKGIFINAIWIIISVVLIDTAMANLEHQTGVRARVPHSEIVNVAFVAAKYFANNNRIALDVMQKLQYLSGSISHSRFILPSLLVTRLDVIFS